MNNPIIITTEQLTYSITTELDDSAYDLGRMVFTMPFTMPGSSSGGVLNITAESLDINIAVEQTYDEPIIYGIGFAVIGTTFIIR